MQGVDDNLQEDVGKGLVVGWAKGEVRRDSLRGRDSLRVSLLKAPAMTLSTNILMLV